MFDSVGFGALNSALDGLALRQRVIARYRVLNLLAHIDPAQRPDRDHLAPG